MVSSILRVAGSTALLLTLTACANPEADRQRYLDSGDRFLAENRIQEAVVEYRNAVRADNRHGESRLKLAEALVRAGEPRRAIREFVRAADLLPDNLDAQVKAATYLSLAGQFEDAKTRLQRVLDREPTNVDAQVLMGNALAGLKDLTGAVAQIEEAIQVDPSRGLSYSNLGLLRIAQGDRDAAAAAFLKAVEVDPKSVGAHLALATFRMQTGDAAGAESSLKSALSLEPGHALGNRALAALYLASNRAADAEAPLRTVAAAGGAAAKLALADYYIRMGRKDDARGVLTPMVGDAATFGDAQSRLAQILYADGDRTQAHALVDEILVKSPNNATVLVIKSRWLMTEGRREEALARAQSAVKASPDSSIAHYLLGVIQADMRDVVAARAAFQEVLRLNPRVAAAQLHLSQLELAAGAPAQAVQLAEAAVKNAPQSPDAQLSLARGLIAQRDLSRAEPIVAALVKQYPTVGEVHALDGTLQLAKKNTGGARAAYTRALQYAPASYPAVSGLTALDLLEKKGTDARARLNQRLADAPANVPLLLLSARTSMALNDLPDAEKTLRRVIELAPADTSAYGLLGQVYLAQRRLDQAQAEFDQLARRNTKDVGSRTLAAVIAHTKNALEDAKTRYRAILEIDPNAPVAANNLAWIYAEEGRDLDEALRLAQTAARAAPDRSDIQDTIGWIYYKKDLPSLAIPPFEQAVAKDPDNALYHLHLGMAFAKNGNVEQARQAVAAALRLNPAYKEAREFQATLR